MNAFKKMFQPIDLTKNRPYKVMLAFALPVFLSLLLSNAFSLINSLVLKVTVGGNAVTSISATGSISVILFNFAYGCSNGFSVISANKRGEHNENAIKKIFINALFLVFLIGIIITIIGLIFYKDLITFLKVDAIYVDMAEQYYQIILLSFIFMLLSNYLSNFLRGMGDSVFPLFISIITTISNIALAFLLTGIIKLNTRGVAIATALSNVINVIISFIYIFKKYPFVKFNFKEIKLETNIIKDLLKMGLPLGFQWSILFIGSFIQSRTINGFGRFATKAVSCYAPIETYLTIPFSSLSTTTLAFMSQNYGANNKTRIKQGIKTSLTIVLIAYLIVGIIGFSIYKYTPYIFLPKEDVNEEVMYFATTYLKVLIPCLILQGCLTSFRSTLLGIKKPLIPLISGIGELLARISICLFLPGIIDVSNPISHKAYLGICFATPSAWSVSFLIMGISVIYFIFIKKEQVTRLAQDVNN